MKVYLSGDEIDLIQESLSMKIASLKQFETHSENQQEVQECEKLLAKTYKWQDILEHIESGDVANA